MLREDYLKILRSIHFQFNSFLSVNDSNQIYLVTLRPTQLTQASFLQKNQMLQNGFLIFLTLR